MTTDDLLKMWKQKAYDLKKDSDNPQFNIMDRIESGAKANQLLQCMLDVKEFLNPENK